MNSSLTETEQLSPDNSHGRRAFHAMNSRSFDECRKLPLNMAQLNASFLNTARRVGFLIVALLSTISLLSVWGAGVAHGQDAGANQDFFHVHAGFDGHFRVGFWTPVRIEFDADTELRDATLSIQVVDGDGISTRFLPLTRKSISCAAGERVSELLYLKAGRIKSRISVELNDQDGSSLHQQTIAWSESTGVMSASQNLHVNLGADIGVSNLGLGAGDDSGATESVVIDVASQIRQLPDHWLGYEGVDRLVVATSNQELVDAISAEQLSAIDQYVSNGGRLVLCTGVNADQLFGKASPWQVFNPGRFLDVITSRSSVGIESYARATKQLLNRDVRTYTLSKFEVRRGRVLAVEGKSLGAVPLVVLYPHGFGQVSFVTVDLDQEPFQSWESKTRFVERIIFGVKQKREEVSAKSGGGQVTSIGYDDITGQLRGALDQFDGVQFVSFTWVAILVIVFILLIGPLDYLFLRRVLGRMELTWITFPAVIIGFCTLAAYSFYNAKGDEEHVNQLEIIDVDGESQSVRGTTWSHLYSPRTSRRNLKLKVADDLQVTVNDQLLSWQGLPGSGISGMDSKVSASVFAVDYSVNLSENADDSKSLTSGLQGLPIQVASSKSLSGRWTGKLQSPVSSRLSIDRRADTLKGQVSNPLPVTITDCVLLFESWAYVFNSDFAPQATVDLASQTDEKTALGFLTYRHMVDGKDVSTPWDAQSDNVARIAQMMSFYRSSGGQKYTDLRHRLQNYIDLSEHLSLGRAVLFGRIEKRLSQIEDSETDLSRNYDKHWTFIRVVYPVEETRSALR